MLYLTSGVSVGRIPRHHDYCGTAVTRRCLVPLPFKNVKMVSEFNCRPTCGLRARCLPALLTLDFASNKQHLHMPDNSSIPMSSYDAVDVSKGRYVPDLAYMIYVAVFAG